MKATIYIPKEDDPESGEIHSVLSVASEADLALNLPTGARYILEHADPRLHRIEKGKPVDRDMPEIPKTRQAKAEARRLLHQHCAGAMRAAFTSSALGAPHIYGNTETDQINRLTAAFLGGRALIACADGSGTWKARPHSAAKLRRVIADGAAWIEACRAHRSEREAEILLAGSEEDIGAIAWNLAPSRPSS